MNNRMLALKAILLPALFLTLIMGVASAGSLTAGPANGVFTPGNIIDVGQSFTINALISGGIAPYNGFWAWSGTNALTLSNTIIQQLPSNDELALTVNAISSNSLVMTFNGVSYDANGIGTSNTIYGLWTLTGNAVDSTGANSVQFTNTFTVDPALSALSLTASNAIADVGQGEVITFTWNGGTPDYTSNIVVSNPTNGVIANALVSSLTSNTPQTLTFTLGASALGTDTINAIVTDSANPPESKTLTTTITVNSALTGVSLTVSNSIVDVGQHETIAYTWSGGTPTYTGNIVVANSVSTLESVHFSGISTTSNTLSFTVPTGATGSYTVTANVFDSASTTESNTLTNTLVANAIPTLIITPNTTTPVYGSSVKFTIEVLNGSNPTTVTLYNVTTSTRRSMGSVIVANSGATNTIIVSPAAIDTFLFRANATDSAGYVFNSTLITITSHGSGSGGGGAGGGLPVGTTVITTTTVSPATTTVVPITTTVPGTAVSSPPAPPKNYTIVGTSYNITSSNQSRTITLPYNCSLPASRLAPYIYINGTWSKIASFTVNAAACTITFTVPPDPIVAIMESPAPTVPTTTAPPSVVTTVAPTTVVSPPVTPPSNAALYAVIVIIIAVIIIVVVGLYLRRRH